MATIRFLLQGKSDNSPIYIRLSAGRGNTPKRKTGLHINPDQWSSSTHFPKQNNAQNKKIKSKLEKLKSFISDRYNDDYSEGVTINGNWLKNEVDSFFNQGNKQQDLNRFSNYLRKFISEADLKRNGKGGLGLSKSRVNDYKTLLKIIEEYESGSILLIRNIDIKFRNDFIKWMTETKKYSKGYTGRMLGTLKTVCLDAEINDIETNPQLKKVSGFKVKNDYVIYLSLDELDQIKHKELPYPYLQNAKKWLLLGCAIGQRGNDILNLTNDNIVHRNGLRVIELEQQKTGKNVTIPVLPEIEGIIEEGFPHKISLQKFNTYIKEVCRIAEINSLTEGKKLNPDLNRHEVGKFPKWQLVTSHICRRSFATNLYGKLPTPLIMQITAHSSEKTFYGYIGKNSYDYAQQIADFYAKQAFKSTNEPHLSVVKKVSNN